jgi:hypothetical protein
MNSTDILGSGSWAAATLARPSDWEVASRFGGPTKSVLPLSRKRPQIPSHGIVGCEDEPCQPA